MGRRVCMTDCQVFPCSFVDKIRNFVSLYSIRKYYECTSHNNRRSPLAIKDFKATRASIGGSWQNDLNNGMC